MAHEDKGHYAAKHNGQKINKTIAQKIKSLADDNCLTCASAHQIAKALNTTPLEIGIQIDLLEYRITQCQLGMFGYSHAHKKFDPNIEIDPRVNSQLDNAADNGRISCLECWNTATNLKIKKLDIGSSCEKKDIRIKPCQLGAF
ncbi:MAG: hypothetical protein GY699_07530 [Desulfobacteraceae bacterium]|nr:hypothetical protein [Desulfobacteraceae bacterium]